MSVSILVDMNLSEEWISHLEQAGWRAVHWSLSRCSVRVRTTSTIGRSCSSGHRTQGIRAGPGFPEPEVVQPHFDTERLTWVGFDLAQALNHFIGRP
jgi:hypothetical protein